MLGGLAELGSRKPLQFYMTLQRLFLLFFAEEVSPAFEDELSDR